MTKKLVVVFFGLTSILGANAKEGKMNKYIITETGKYSSLDPLDADSTTNLPVARMIYSTPLEISAKNELSSALLESFKVTESGKRLEFLVKRDLRFSDGTPITPSDVAFAIQRMAWSKPRFPVLEQIEGLGKWLSEKSPLRTSPAGIQVSGQMVSIVFAKKVHNPLFRFCLELFSVIPKKCVNLDTGKIECAEIPSSGNYRISSQDESSVQFRISEQGKLNIKGPEEIRFEYWPAASVESRLSTLGAGDVLAGNESMFSYDQMINMGAKSRVSYLPAARFTDMDLNPASEFFKEKLCRQVFADTFRVFFGKVSQKYTNVEASIFTRIVPGFKTVGELRTKTFANLSKSDRDYCKKRIQQVPFQWGYVSSEKNSAFVEALEMTLQDLGYPDREPLIANSRKELSAWFVEGKVAITSGGSGFWAHDPVGDLQMLFTPNLHRSLDFVTKDENLQRLIGELRDSPTDSTKIDRVNQYIHDEALFNVYSYVRRFFLSNDQQHKLDLQFAITSPAPWQVFVR